MDYRDENEYQEENEEDYEYNENEEEQRGIEYKDEIGYAKNHEFGSDNKENTEENNNMENYIENEFQERVNRISENVQRKLMKEEDENNSVKLGRNDQSLDDEKALDKQMLELQILNDEQGFILFPLLNFDDL